MRDLPRSIMLSSAGPGGRLPLIGTGEHGRALFWREKTEFWQALTTCAEQRPLRCFPTARRLCRGSETGSWNSSSTIRNGELSADCSRNAERSLLKSRKTPPNPTVPVAADQLSCRLSSQILGKRYASEMSGQPVHQPRGSGRRNELNLFPSHISLANGFRSVFDGAVVCPWR